MKIRRIWSRGTEEEGYELTDESTERASASSLSLDYLSEETSQRKSEKRAFMKKNELHDREEVNTIISRGATFEGTFHIVGGLWVEGTLRGEVVCSDTLTVGQDGDVEANLRARDLVIAGTVVGGIEAESRVTLRSTARFQGEIKAMALIVEEGAVLRADCDIGESRLSFSLPGREISEMIS